MRHPREFLLSRRATFLLTLGVLQIIIGWTLLGAPAAAFQTFTIFRHMPVSFRNGFWFVPGGVAVFSSFTRRHVVVAIAFALSYLSLFLWGSIYVLSWLVFSDVNFPTALRASAIYYAFAALIMIAAGWPELIGDNSSDRR